MEKKKIINAHAHVFTSQFVPPYLAKTIVPWPLYYLIRTYWIVGLIKKYYKRKNRLKFPTSRDYGWDKIYKKRRSIRSKTLFNFYINARPVINIPYRIIVFWLSFVTVLYVIEFLTTIVGIPESVASTIQHLKDWLSEYYLFFKLPVYGKVIWALFVLIFIDWSRRILLFAVKSIFPLFRKILSTKGLELLERYLLMGRFALYKTQKNVAERALHQLPPGSQMVILPMDMEYMGSGKTKIRRDLLRTKKKNLKDGWTEEDYQDTYKYQMRELWDFVDSKRNSDKNPSAYHPFLFLDPRRIAEEGKKFFDYEVVNNEMVLNDCFIKTYMEDRKFSGFKMYPALGYYPFDEHLLPIWRYAVENNIPIMSHCIIGTIYYRGSKKKEWNFHPVFKQYYRDRRKEENVPEPMLLPQVKAIDLQLNFTHPLNYLCLLEETLLREFMKGVKSQKTRDLFGYKDEKTPLSFTLENLKVCLAHYGGEDEWTKYLESDRDAYSRSIIKKPNQGIAFMENSDGDFSLDKINSIWNDTDWYSIISSILMQYDNMYADLSYIISKPTIYPLLNETLRKGDDYDAQYEEYLKEPSDNKKASKMIGRNRLRSHILYGTDFYVVRNHNSDKDLFVETKAAIDEESFDLIARENPHNYLSRN